MDYTLADVESGALSAWRNGYVELADDNDLLLDLTFRMGFMAEDPMKEAVWPREEFLEEAP